MSDGLSEYIKTVDLPCIFCESEKVDLTGVINFNRLDDLKLPRYLSFFVEREHCEASGPSLDSDSDAISAWQRVLNAL